MVLEILLKSNEEKRTKVFNQSAGEKKLCYDKKFEAKSAVL